MRSCSGRQGRMMRAFPLGAEGTERAAPRTTRRLRTAHLTPRGGAAAAPPSLVAQAPGSRPAARKCPGASGCPCPARISPLARRAAGRVPDPGVWGAGSTAQPQLWYRPGRPRSLQRGCSSAVFCSVPARPGRSSRVGHGRERGSCITGESVLLLHLLLLGSPEAHMGARIAPSGAHSTPGHWDRSIRSTPGQ